MKKLFLLALLFGFVGNSFASTPIYEVKKESVEVYVAQDYVQGIEAIASVSLKTFEVKEYSKENYSVSVLFVNDSVAAIKTRTKEFHYLYVFKASKESVLIFRNKKKDSIEYNKPFESSIKNYQKPIESKFLKQLVFEKNRKRSSGTRIKTRIEFLC